VILADSVRICAPGVRRGQKGIQKGGRVRPAALKNEKMEEQSQLSTFVFRIN
jgi:hypothetical protein